MNNVKRSFLTSLISLVLCLTMFLGTTFAWFTDIVVSGGNVIQSGNLDAEMYWSDEYLASTDSGWTQVKDNKPIFTYDNWEPGYTEIKYIKVANAGNLNFKWKLSIEAEGKVTDLSDVIDVYYVNPVNGELTKQALAARTPDGKLTDVLANKTATEGDQLTPGGSVVLAIAFHMDELAGNEYQEKSLCDKGFSLKLLATQATGENDSFDDQYDKESEWPEIPSAGNNASADVPTDANGVVTTATTITGNGMSATVPAGTQLTQGTNKLTLSVNNVEDGKANVTLAEGEELRALDVHISGVAEGNTTPIAVTLTEALPKGLNIGNYTLHHVEDGQTVAMTLLADSATPVHNNFTYDPVTGDVTLYMASFSEVALVANNENAWKGELDYSWYDASKKEFTIANADQLAAFSAIVGGMDGQKQDSFSGKTVKLVADINLGDKESENNPEVIFYPIGYYNSEGTYERTNTAITSGLRIFEGTFDGNGHTVSNFYHNTWEMKGDHDWYSPEEQYYRDGMGLFGRVYKGTVKNLTVKNFSSDGEIATTGVIAAYADGATFENIAIFNCNPRVYNIGNGGIVGCVGWYAKDAGLTTTFKNITVDNSNKISALWGSYDVACGGIVGQYYPTSGQTSANKPVNGGISFENCHVSAIMDVYNDVCANYQYYAYRYTGMLIGSVRENVTIDGHSYPKMDGITAKDCTVHFGTWNDYYYCEIIDNTTASYTHDYQMSRLQEIKAIDGTTITYLDDTTGTVPSSGRANYVIVDYSKGHGTENATCYHFKDGAVWTHDMGGIQTGVDENGDGQDDLKEDKQHIYLEFNNLVTGYGWGVTTKGVGDLAGVTILDREVADSVDKFTPIIKNEAEFTTESTVTIGELFKAVTDAEVAINPESVQVAVSPFGATSTAGGTYVANTTDWTQGTLTFSGVGQAVITITDYYFCKTATVTVNIVGAEKFDTNFVNYEEYLYRVGNADKSTVALGTIFKHSGNGTINSTNVEVTFASVAGNASGTFTKNTSDWTKGTIQFTGTGVVKVTIKDATSKEFVLYLEVVAATNAISATDAKDKDVVLLNNIGSGFTVDNGHTVYGNGFTLNYTGDGRYLNNGLKQGVVMVQNGGTLDNLHIKASIYPTAFMYYGATQMGDYVQQSSNPREVEGDKTRYYYQLSAVATYGDATISNCYIYGGRTNIYVNTGDVTIKDTVLECGTVANIQIQSKASHTITLENLTTIQHQVKATIGDTSKVMLGAGVIVGPDTEENPKIVLNGYFKQYNWVTQDDADVVSSSTVKMIINGALGEDTYNHTINGKKASNLGIIYMNEAAVDVENNTGLPYVLGNVTLTADIGISASVDGQVYSVQGASGAHIYSDCENADRSTVNGDYIPRFDFNLGNQEITYDGSDDTRYLYGDKNGVTALYQDGDTAITLDLTKLATIYKYDGINYTVTAVCKDSSGNTLTASNGVVTLSAQGSYTIEFTVNDNIFYNQNGGAITKSVERTYTVPLTLTVKEANVKNAVVDITKTALDGVYTLSGLDDYKLRINFLECISVTDYDNKGNGTTVSLSSNIASVSLTPASVNVFTTASTITVTYTDGRVLTVNLSKISGSSPGTKTATVNTSGGLYFITDGALNNKPTEASSQNKCTITSVSFKGNSGSVVTNDTDVTVTWELGSSSGGGGCVTPDTLVTLADGSQVRVDSLKGDELLLVWNMETGKLDYAPIMFVDSEAEAEYEIIHLYFSDGTDVKVIYEHGFWDYDLNKYVYLDRNAADYIGHTFAKQNGDKLEKVTLTDVVIKTELTTAWSPVTVGHLCYFVNGMLSMPGGVGGLFNIFEVDPETMTYDYEQLEKDIETYGLFTYEELNAICPLTEEMFNAAGGAYLKISIGKGNLTMEELIDMIDRYSKFI